MERNWPSKPRSGSAHKSSARGASQQAEKGSSEAALFPVPAVGILDLLGKDSTCASAANYPIITVTAPGPTMTPPCEVWSPTRAAGIPPISTVGHPGGMIVSGGPTQVHISPTRAAGSPPISTVGHPGGKTGPPTCGTTPVTIGQVCISLTRAAGGISVSFGSIC